MIKYYTFQRESDDFTDVLEDINLKKIIVTKIQWVGHLMIGVTTKKNDGTSSYITLKYGDDIKDPEYKDFTPVPGLDYIPKKDKNLYTRHKE